LRTTHLSRPRVALNVEPLEDRLVLTGYQPTPYEQLFLERLNDARANPTLYGQSIGFDLSSVASSQPLALDPRIIQAARNHSQDMSNQNYFGHVDPSGHDPGYRLDAVGFPWTTFGESIAAGFNTPEDALKALIIDQGEPDLGHRLQLLAMQPIYQVQSQVGVGIVLNGSGTYKNYFTIDTGVTADTRPFLTGVVYNDLNHNGKYDLNESVSGVTVNVAGVGSFPAFDTGGYSVQLSPGHYTVWFTGPGFTTAPTTVTIGSTNVRLNVDVSSLNSAAFTAWVTQVGQDLLQRPLRQDEVSGLVSWMQAGQSKAGIVQSLTHTAEYVQIDNQRWVNDTEATVLGRVPRADEVTAWVNYLQGGGSRANLVAMTLGTLYANSDNATFLLALGQDLLGRALAPYEVNAWLTYMQQGASRQYVVAAFMGSPEYQSRDNARWVNEIGQATLQRALQAYEVSYWANYLLAGNSRDAVLSAFVQCNEFMNLLPTH
jgi:hypothetical protein